MREINWQRIIGTVIVMGLVGSVGAWMIYSDGDGIEEGKVYGLAYTLQVSIENGDPIDGRIFLFTDRNLPRPSILAPARDARGMALIREDESMEPGTICKVRVRVPKRVVEDVVYPAYEYLEWRYKMGVKEPQSHVPIVTPRR